jgi:hypothetical protein
MEVYEFQRLREKVIAAGYGDEIIWVEGLPPVSDAEFFAREYVFVVISAGMRNQVVEVIYKRVIEALQRHIPLSGVFGHKSKSAAILGVWNARNSYFEKYLESTDKVEWLKTLPWIGDITKYHLARNLGIDCVKPDRHLVRIANKENTTPFKLCKHLAYKTGYRIGTVDVILWRAANLGYV